MLIKSLNPLRIGEGFEPKSETTSHVHPAGLNPLRIGEGFERTQAVQEKMEELVLIP